MTKEEIGFFVKAPSVVAESTIEHHFAAGFSYK
jgi:hypothetical protein